MNKKLLEEVHTALNDWLHVYAPIESGEENVKETYNRIKEKGGTIAYIANLTKRIRNEIENAH